MDIDREVSVMSRIAQRRIEPLGKRGGRALANCFDLHSPGTAFAGASTSSGQLYD